MLNRFSRVQLFVTLWTVACHAPLSMEFSRQESMKFSKFNTVEWVVISFSRGSFQPRDWTHISYVSYIANLVFFTTSATWEVQNLYNIMDK